MHQTGRAAKNSPCLCLGLMATQERRSWRNSFRRILAGFSQESERKRVKRTLGEGEGREDGGTRAAREMQEEKRMEGREEREEDGGR